MDGMSDIRNEIEQRLGVFARQGAKAAFAIPPQVMQSWKFHTSKMTDLLRQFQNSARKSFGDRFDPSWLAEHTSIIRSAISALHNGRVKESTKQMRSWADDFTNTYASHEHTRNLAMLAREIAREPAHVLELAESQGVKMSRPGAKAAFAGDWHGKRVTSNAGKMFLVQRSATGYDLYSVDSGKKAKSMTQEQMDEAQRAGKFRDVFSRPGAKAKFAVPEGVIAGIDRGIANMSKQRAIDLQHHNEEMAGIYEDWIAELKHIRAAVVSGDGSEKHAAKVFRMAVNLDHAPYEACGQAFIRWVKTGSGFARAGAKATMGRAEDLYRKLSSGSITYANAKEWDRLVTEALRLPDYTPPGGDMSLHEIAEDLGGELMAIKTHRGPVPNAKATAAKAAFSGAMVGLTGGYTAKAQGKHRYKVGDIVKTNSTVPSTGKVRRLVYDQYGYPAYVVETASSGTAQWNDSSLFARPGAKATMGILDRISRGLSAATAKPVDPTTPQYLSGLTAAKKAAEEAKSNYEYMADLNDARFKQLDNYVKVTSNMIAKMNSSADIQRLIAGLKAAVAARVFVQSSMKTPFSRLGDKTEFAEGCGSGAGGFKPGNTCGKEDGKAGGGGAKKKKKPTSPKPATPRLTRREERRQELENRVKARQAEERARRGTESASAPKAKRAPKVSREETARAGNDAPSLRDSGDSSNEDLRKARKVRDDVMNEGNGENADRLDALVSDLELAADEERRNRGDDYDFSRSSRHSMMSRLDVIANRYSAPIRKVNNCNVDSKPLSYGKGCETEQDKAGLKLMEKADKSVSDKIRTLIKEGKPQDQAVAIALDMKRRGEL